MQRIIDYLASLSPALTQGIEGASREDIERLAQLSGRELPPSYRAFLERMGRSMGKLRVPHADLRIETALAFYSRKDVPQHPRQCVFLAEDGNDPYADYYLDGRADGEEPVVVRYSGEGAFVRPHVWVTYRTLEEMLLTSAFLGLRMRALPLKALCTPSGAVDWSDPSREPLMTGFHKIAAQLGFTLVAGTGPWSPCYERGDLAMRGYQPPPQRGMSIEVGATDPEVMAVTLEILSDNLGMAIP